MGKLNLSIFDTFAYVLPGFLTLVAAVLLFNESIHRAADAAEVAQQLDLASGLALLIAAYILGFGVDTVGDKLHKYVGFRIWGEPYCYMEVGILEGRALVREYSPENHTYIQTWKVMCSMSHNLSVATILVALAAIIKAVQYPSLDWMLLSGGCIILAYVFLYRAHIFDQMHYRDLKVAVEALHLDVRKPESSKGQQTAPGQQ